jgi:hypothetical protein
MLMIRTLSGVLSLTRWLTHTAPSAVVVLLALAVTFVVQDAVHAVITFGM